MNTGQGQEDFKQIFILESQLRNVVLPQVPVFRIVNNSFDGSRCEEVYQVHLFSPREDSVLSIDSTRWRVSILMAS